MGTKQGWIAAVLFITAIVFISPVPQASATEEKPVGFDISVGTAAMLDGHTTYQIGGVVKTAAGDTQRVQMPLSKLEFPLESWWLNLDATVNVNRWRFRAGGRFNMTDPDDPMIDSDWGLFGYPPEWENTKTIESKSEADLDSYIFDIGVDYVFWQTQSGWEFSGGLGWMYQNFDYDVYNTRQYYPSPLINDYSGDYVGGDTLKYEVTYSIPYMKLGTAFNYKGVFELAGSAAWSPIAQGEDEDQHLLRDKVNEGETDGDAWIFMVRGQYNMPWNLYLGLQWDYVKIDLSGESKAYFGGVYDHKIDLEHTSDQNSLLLELGYKF